tara:strand:+ start:92 stop:262 length:171 start_codon:yes stop_codon:yes gene_type:complete
MAYSMKGFGGFGNEESKKDKRKRKKEERKHDRSAKKAYREDHPGFLNRLFGKYKTK